MKSIIGVLVIAFFFLVFVHPAQAQQPKKIPRVAYLNPGFPSTGPLRIEAFLQGLRERGYIDGQDIIIEYRYAERKRDRYLTLAADLVNLKVDVIVTLGSTATRAVKETTSTIPIVMANDPDPVGNQLARRVGCGAVGPGHPVTRLDEGGADGDLFRVFCSWAGGLCGV